MNIQVLSIFVAICMKARWGAVVLLLPIFAAAEWAWYGFIVPIASREGMASEAVEVTGVTTGLSVHFGIPFIGVAPLISLIFPLGYGLLAWRILHPRVRA